MLALVPEAGLWKPPEQPAVQEPADSVTPMDIDVSRLESMLSNLTALCTVVRKQASDTCAGTSLLTLTMKSTLISEARVFTTCIVLRD